MGKLSISPAQGLFDPKVLSRELLSSLRLYGHHVDHEKHGEKITNYLANASFPAANDPILKSLPEILRRATEFLEERYASLGVEIPLNIAIGSLKYTGSSSHHGRASPSRRSVDLEISCDINGDPIIDNIFPLLVHEATHALGNYLGTGESLVKRGLVSKGRIDIHSGWLHNHLQKNEAKNDLYTVLFQSIEESVAYNHEILAYTSSGYEAVERTLRCSFKAKNQLDMILLDIAEEITESANGFSGGSYRLIENRFGSDAELLYTQNYLTKIEKSEYLVNENVRWSKYSLLPPIFGILAPELYPEAGLPSKSVETLYNDITRVHITGEYRSFLGRVKEKLGSLGVKFIAALQTKDELSNSGDMSISVDTLLLNLYVKAHALPPERLTAVRSLLCDTLFFIKNLESFREPSKRGRRPEEFYRKER